MFKFLLYKVGQFLVNRLPKQLSYTLAECLSDLQYFFSFRDRRAVRNNLKVILPDQQQHNFYTREVFRNFGRYLVEFFRMETFLDLNFVQEHMICRNLHIIDNVLKENRGGILISGHIGNWELGGASLSLMGYSITAVALPHKERPVNELFNHQRVVKGLHIVPTHLAIRRGYETLKNNNLLALIADRDFGESGEVLDFFGKKAVFPKGPAIFSVRTGAPIIPIFFIRTKDDIFEMQVEKPLYPPQSSEASEEKRVVTMIEKIVDLLEEKIRQYPSQWLMFRRFWIDSKHPAMSNV